jgi:MOSC domain-containing protein YiiM
MNRTQPEHSVLLAIHVGTPRTYGRPDAEDPMDREWTTSFFKDPVTGPVWVHRTCVEGDQPANEDAHGGPEQAALIYSADHYPTWRRELEMSDFGYGAFGENFSVSGLTEDTVCVGDVLAVGAARLEVSKPRAPCWKINRRWRRDDLTRRVQETGRTGWYVRVLEEGAVEQGQPLSLEDRPCPEWTISRVSRVMGDRQSRPEHAAALARCEYLSPDWREKLARAASVPPSS